MLYECTDCKHCANFSSGFRVFCMHPDLPPEEVCEYFPVGDRDAYNCKGFDEGYNSKLDFSWDDFTAAEEFGDEKYGGVTYQSVREWIEQRLKE